MDEETSLACTSASDLDVVSSNIVDKIVKEENPEKLKDLVDAFNLAISKKTLVRVDKYHNLLDKIAEQMSERITENPYEFSNKDLIDYLNAIYSALGRNSSVDTETLNMPVIQHNTQVNINVETLDRQSKERVAEAVRSIMDKMRTPGSGGTQSNSDIIDVDF